MAKGDDFPKRIEEDTGDEQRGEEQPLSEEFVADASMRKRAAQLSAELERARADEAVFEQRFGMTFEEFQASFDPEADPDSSEAYLAWSRAAERVRMLRYELDRLSEGRPRRRRATAAPEEDEETAEGVFMTGGEMKRMRVRDLRPPRRGTSTPKANEATKKRRRVT